MKTKLIATSLVLATVVTGCDNPKQTIGTLGGGAAGALIGSSIGSGRGRVVATAVGGVLGAVAGGAIGAQLDKADREAAARANQSALESGRNGSTSTWRNPDTGHHGSITPTRTYERNGQPCREFTQTIYVGGKREEGVGRACRQADGSWQIVSN